MKKTVIAMLTLAIGIMAVSCKKADVLPSSVSVTPSTATVTEGETATFTASVLPAEAVYSGITWSSSDTKVATVNNGVVTGVKAGSATITASADGVSGTATVTVTAKIIAVTGVSLDKTELALTEGEEAQLKATVAPDNATEKSVNWKSSDEKVATVSSEGKVTAVAPGETVITVTTEDGGKTATCEVTVIPEGALTGVFSVSADKKVRFSKGNLIATIDAEGIPTSWRFATNQYDCIGKGGANETIGSAAGDVDLFGWSTASTCYGISTSTYYTDYSGDFKDWGTAIDSKGTWRTLTGGYPSEWEYLLGMRPNASNLLKYDVIICGRKCLVLAPDNFTGSILTTYDAAGWTEAEKAGLVCLPIAGRRSGSSCSDLDSYDYGNYWSATPEAEGHFAFNMLCRWSRQATGNCLSSRSLGCSVRLVADVK